MPPGSVRAFIYRKQQQYSVAFYSLYESKGTPASDNCPPLIFPMFLSKLHDFATRSVDARKVDQIFP